MAEDETYWREIQRAFDLDRTMVNLNNGGCSPAPTHVLEQMIRDLKFSNELPSEHMWRVLEPRIESVRRDLAQEFGCDPEEMAITRNASEANETMIFGLDLKRGDEVIFTTQNYPRMQNAWKQRERRDGIVLKPVKIETPVKSTKSYVDQIAAAITPRTKVIEVMHISFMTGYIAPVREIVDLAKPQGHSGVRRRRARVRALPVHARRARRRLLRHEPPQVDARADRHRASSTCAATRSSRSGRSWPAASSRTTTSASTRRSARIRRRTTTRSPSPSRSSAASAWSARSRGCAICAIAGRSSCSRRAIACT